MQVVSYLFEEEIQVFNTAAESERHPGSAECTAHDLEPFEPGEDFLFGRDSLLVKSNCDAHKIELTDADTAVLDDFYQLSIEGGSVVIVT